MSRAQGRLYKFQALMKENFDAQTFCLDICVVERNQHIRQIDTVHLLIIVPYYLGTFYCNAPFLGTVPSFHFMHIIWIPLSRANIDTFVIVPTCDKNS